MLHLLSKHSLELRNCLINSQPTSSIYKSFILFTMQLSTVSFSFRNHALLPEVSNASYFMSKKGWAFLCFVAINLVLILNSNYLLYIKSFWNMNSTFSMVNHLKGVFVYKTRFYVSFFLAYFTSCFTFNVRFLLQ